MTQVAREVLVFAQVEEARQEWHRADQAWSDAIQAKYPGRDAGELKAAGRGEDYPGGPLTRLADEANRLKDRFLNIQHAYRRQRGI